MKIYLFSLLYLLATQIAPFIHLHVQEGGGQAHLHWSIHPPEHNQVSENNDHGAGHHSKNTEHEPDDVHFEGDHYYPATIQFSSGDSPDEFVHQILNIQFMTPVTTGINVLLPQKIPDLHLPKTLPNRAPPISA